MANSTFWIVAIDFGTAYSGYCYCLRTNPNNIRSPVWGEKFGQRTLKTPTCILFDEQGDFRLFGYDALMTYKMNPKSRECYFHNFKMELYQKTISRNMIILDSSRRPMLAMKVFSESMKYIKTHALKTIASHTSGKTFIAADVTWVLTVPAIWDPAAKQFMREAATEAGLVSEMNSSNLIITLEPEAASAWCKRLPSTGFLDDALEDAALEQKPGTQYTVVDCGGGTIDIAVHQILEEGFLKEIYKASGGDMGGGSVDAKFISVFRDIFHPTLWDKYESAYPSELQKMLFDFTMIKCAQNEEDVYIPCPTNLREMAERQKNMQAYFESVDGVTWVEGSFKITYSKLKTFFTESLTRIVNQLKTIFSTAEINIDIIFLVGGYSSCEILQTEIKKHFDRRCRILCPVDANLAVAKGAVLMGRNPKIVTSRVCALTYGISEARDFDPSQHKVEKRRKNKTKDYIYCADLFHRLVQKGQSVKCDEEKNYYFSPIDDDQTIMRFTIYSTEAPNAVYVDDPGMKQIGTFTVSMPDISKGRERSVKFLIKFGLTEMEATATDITSGKTKSIRLDFLTH